MKEHVVEIKGGKYRYRYNEQTQKTEYLGPVGSAPDLGEGEFLKEMAYTDLVKDYFPNDQGHFESWSPEFREFFVKNIVEPMEIQKEQGYEIEINDMMDPPSYLLTINVPGSDPDLVRRGMTWGYPVLRLDVSDNIWVIEPARSGDWNFDDEQTEKLKGRKIKAKADFEEAVRDYLTRLPSRGVKRRSENLPDFDLDPIEWARRHRIPQKPVYERKRGYRGGYYMKKTDEVWLPNLWM